MRKIGVAVVLAVLVAFLGLDWDERCLAFHENRRVVTTSEVVPVVRHHLRLDGGDHNDRDDGEHPSRRSGPGGV